MEDPVTQARGLSLVRTLPTGESIRTVGPSPRLSATPPAVTRLAGPPGSDLDAILQRLDLGDDLDHLVEVGAVLDELPEGVEFVGRFRPAATPAR
jgi:crotonobetainyl-CoA:carnitine CoA-transferase CaiB-like acyl-CoA transferase